MRTISLLAVFTCAIVAHVPSATGASFVGLGDLPGGGTSSLAYGVSADGSVVVGQSSSAAGTEAVRWVGGGGIQSLGAGNSARAVSADGSVIVGNASNQVGGGEVNYYGFRWQGGVEQNVLPGDELLRGYASAVSADGSVVAGESFNEAAIWVSGSGVQYLGVSSPSPESRATAISASGLVVGGDTLGEGAFRWEGGTVTYLDPGSWQWITDISADGSVMLGGTAAETALWEDGVTTGLGFRMPGAVSLSPDGTVIYGFDGSEHAVLTWDALNGLQSLDLEDDLGLDLSGWSSLYLRDVSDDGKTLVGYGTNSSWNTEGWVLVIPEPATALLVGLGLLLLKLKRRGGGITAGQL